MNDIKRAHLVARGSADSGQADRRQYRTEGLGIMHDDVIELDGGVIDFDLKRSEPPLRSSYFYLVVIGGSIDVGFAQIHPASRV